MEEKEKEALFDELYQLDEEDSSEEDQSNASVILRQNKPALPWSDVLARAPRSRVINSPRPEQSLLRTVSATLPQPSASNRHQTNIVERSSFFSTASSNPSQQVIIDTPIITKEFVGMTARNGASRTIGKRKRSESLEVKPESQQIFNRLAFCQSRDFKSCNSIVTNLT